MNNKKFKVEDDGADDMIKVHAGDRHGVSVYLPTKSAVTDGIDNGGINWSANGTVSVDDAREYAEMIIKACDVYDENKNRNV